MKSHETGIQNRQKDYIKKYRLHARRYQRKMYTAGGVWTVYGVSVGVETGFFAKNDTRDVTHIHKRARRGPQILPELYSTPSSLRSATRTLL